MIRFPKAGTGQVGTSGGADEVAPVVAREETKQSKRPADGMLPDAPRPLPNPHVPVQGNSLIERTLRYDQVQIGKAEAKLAPLVAQMQSNGWFPPETIAAIARAETKEEIIGLIQQSPGGVTAFGRFAEVDGVAADIMKSPAQASTVLILASSAQGLERFGGALANSATNDIQSVSMSLRHYENTSGYLQKGFAQYTSLEQMTAARDTAMSDGVKGFWQTMAPLKLDDIRALQTEYQTASGVQGNEARDAAQGKVVDKLKQLLSTMPAPLWRELTNERGELIDRVDNLLRRGPYGTDWEQSRNVVSMFLTNGEHGAPLHGLFDKGLQLEFFIGGGFIPDKVSRGAGELW